MMGVTIRSQRGVSPEQAAELVTEARGIAARLGDDAGAPAALAEAEHDEGNDAAAIAAADRALALDPQRANAYVQKGLALFRQAGESDDITGAYAMAMQPFEKLNALENDHPLPLIHYYQSYTRRSVKPPENAKAALERASQLAPFDTGLKLKVALMLLTEGKLELARAFLQPIAVPPTADGSRTMPGSSSKSSQACPTGRPLVQPCLKQYQRKGPQATTKRKRTARYSGAPLALCGLTPPCAHGR